MEKNDKNRKKEELSDLVDSAKDLEEMKQGPTEIYLPDVDEIPGQKDFIPAPLGEMADTTASSADEEGEDIFGDDIDEDIMENPDSNVSQSEKEDLAITAHDMPGDDENLREAALDSTDEDGAPLNEESFKKNVTASDLDIPGADLDDDEENIGEEDEENNDYSLGADNENIPRDDF
jgi:hypothetical protein